MWRSKAGFTLVELLIATVVGAILLLLINQILVSSAQSQSRAEVSLPLQQSVRGAEELIDMNLREANGVRVLVNDGTNPAALAGYASSASRLTVVSAPSGQAFGIQQPAGYGSSQAQVAAGTTTALSPILYTDPASTSPVTTTRNCSDVFSGGDWFLLVVPQRPVQNANGSYQAAGATTTLWGQASASSPCAGNTLAHAAYSYPAFNWTPSAAVLRLTITSYYLGTVGGLPVLYRQQAGGPAQVVAFDVTDMQVQYSADGQNFGATPMASPLSVRVSLTATASRQPLGPGSLPSYNESMTTFMRKTTIPNAAFSSGY